MATEWLQIAWAILLTVISGIVYSLIFYAKAWKEGEEFSYPKFVRTVIWGALIGVFAYQLRLSMPDAELYMTTFGGGFLVIIVDQIATAFWAKYGAAILAALGMKPEPPAEPPKEEEKKEVKAPPTPLTETPPVRGCPLNPPLAGR